MKKVKLLVILLTLFLLQGVALAQQTGESSFNPSSYTLNPKIKVGDSILMKADIAQTKFPNGTVVPYDIQSSTVAWPENGTVKMTLVSLDTNIYQLNGTFSYSNGTFNSHYSDSQAFTGLIEGKITLPPSIMTTNTTLLNSIKFVNNSLSGQTGNYSTTVNNNHVIVNGTLESPHGNYITYFKYIYDKESGWPIEEYQSFIIPDYINQSLSDTFTLELVTVAVSSGARISSLPSLSSSTPDFFAYQMLAGLIVMSLFVLKKKRL